VGWKSLQCEWRLEKGERRWQKRQKASLMWLGSRA
jgi:hypothetical protein